MIASVQTQIPERRIVTHMLNQIVGWRTGAIVTVMWGIVVMTFGWVDLPRAPHMPHDPGLESKLSDEAVSILSGSDAKADAGKHTSGDMLVWTEQPRTARMANGEQLTFPATTTTERAAFVESEYHELLNIEAGAQREPYLLELLAIWLVPLAIGGLALRLLRRQHYALPGSRTRIARRQVEDRNT